MNWKLWSILNLLWFGCLTEVAAAHRVLPGVLCDSWDATSKLCIINLQQGESQWFLITAEG
jgi:hypothetical protein